MSSYLPSAAFVTSTDVTVLALRTFYILLAHFHLSEFALAVRYDRGNVGWRSFLISKPYCVAMTLALVEFKTELAVFGEAKTRALERCLVVGVFVCVFGEWLRKYAMITAGGAFTHVIQTYRRPRHVLVVDGPYAYARHPGYLGWFAWVVGTQVVLGNPACACGFAVVSYRYFVRRIAYEEAHLRRMFPDYDAYAARTPSWFPKV